ncbi:hypothetical protein LCGC14_0478470 [marine sediment metagenome]|uniref:Shikimate kinase n=1 Tax=marine sediment metagenome TaxID=412755 RepID=A0A0F9VIP1_9ZZZZ
MIYILIGEMGVGKNYIGKMLANQLGCNFFDGDDALPANLKKKVANFQSLTLDEIEGFVKNNLIPQIEKEKSDKIDLVVAQALYRSDHRDIITAHFGQRLLSRVKWVYVKPPSLFTHMGRLFSRDKGLRWALLGLLSKPFFQKPAIPIWTIENTTGMKIVVF